MKQPVFGLAPGLVAAFWKESMLGAKKELGLLVGPSHSGSERIEPCLGSQRRESNPAGSLRFQTAQLDPNMPDSARLPPHHPKGTTTILTLPT